MFHYKCQDLVSMANSWLDMHSITSESSKRSCLLKPFCPLFCVLSFHFLMSVFCLPGPIWLTRRNDLHDWLSPDDVSRKVLAGVPFLGSSTSQNTSYLSVHVRSLRSQTCQTSLLNLKVYNRNLSTTVNMLTCSYNGLYVPLAMVVEFH